MREVGLDFLECADKVWVMEATVAAPRAEVWRAISDPTVWPLLGASYPLARAQLESTELEELDGATLMRWTIASDRGPLLWLATPIFHRTVTRLWSRAAANLERWLASPERGARC